MLRAPLIALAGFAAILFGGAWSLSQLQVDTDITRFLPPSGNPRDESVARALVSSELSRTLTLTIEAPGADEAGTAARLIADHLSSQPDLAWVRSGSDPDFEQAFYELYYPRRFEFAASSEEEAAALVGGPELRSRARLLREQLASPTSPLLGQVAPHDPWMLFVGHLQRQGRDGSLRPHQGSFVTDDGRHGVVLLASKSSPFEVNASRRILESIQGAFEQLPDQHRLSLEVAGVHRFVVQSADATQADIVRVSAAGAAVAALFLLFVFRSFWLLLVGHLPLVSGVAGGLLVSAVFVGRIHGLTLAFGATLIGVAVDYVSHLLNHHVLKPAPEGAIATARRIAPALLLGGATTIAGIAGLGWTGHRAIQEMALFTSAGIVVALFTSLVFLPRLLPARPNPSGFHRWLASNLERGFARWRAHPRGSVVVLLLVVTLGALGLSRASFVDDHRALSTLDPELVAEEQRVRERVARVDQSLVVVAQGDSLQAALEANDRVYASLSALQSAGTLERFRSLHEFVRAESTQLRVRSVLRDAGANRTIDVYTSEGFAPGAFAAFATDLNAEPEPIHLEDLDDTPLADLTRPFVLDDAETPTLVTFVGGIRDRDALSRALDSIPGAFVFDQAVFAADGYQRFRERTTELLLVGLAAVFLLLLIRYRQLASTLAAFVPAVLAGLVALGAASLLGETLTFIHVVTVLVVLSMGVDYGVFLVESGRDQDLGPTLASLCVACVSTVASFGALALSAQPAMRAMGLVTAVGVLASLVLAPAVWALTHARR